MANYFSYLPLSLKVSNWVERYELAQAPSKIILDQNWLYGAFQGFQMNLTLLVRQNVQCRNTVLQLD
jgi:hypothetical protein